MTSKEFERRRQTLSNAVDNIFERYTIIPSSETEDDGIQTSDLGFRTIEKNSDKKRLPILNPFRPEYSQNVCGPSFRKTSAGSDTGTIEPQRTQLAVPSTSTTEGSYARKTIPIHVETQKEISDSDSNSISETGNAVRTVLNIPSCDSCYEQNITCERKNRGRACVSCSLKRKRCNLVQEPSPKPGARRTSDRGSHESGTSSTDVDFSFRDDTGDESFELDSEKVTLQRILGHLLRLNRKQEERFGTLENNFRKMQKEIVAIREELWRLSAEKL